MGRGGEGDSLELFLSRKRVYHAVGCLVPGADVVTACCLLCSVDRASAFKVLLAMESILASVARGNEHNSLVDLVLNGPVGHVTPRKMGVWAAHGGDVSCVPVTN